MVEDVSVGRRVFVVFNFCILSLLAFICLYPLWYTFCLSTSDKAAANAGMVTIVPVRFTLVAFQEIIRDKAFFTSFWISIKRVTMGVSIDIVCIILFAYALSRSKKEFFARDIIMWINVFCMLFSAGTIPWYIFMKNYGMIDNIWGMVFAGGYSCYYTVLMMNFFKSFPRELEEAATVDGAGKWRQLWQIVVPCSIPSIATIMLFVGVWYWNEYFIGLVLSTSENSYPLQTYIRQIVVVIPMGQTLSQEEMIRLSKLSNKTLNAAKVFITIIPMLMVYPFIQKYFVTGIMIGAVKG